MDAERYWKNFLQAEGLSEDTRYFDCFHFELSEKLANELLELVLAGKKRATASSLKSFEAEGLRLPCVGDYNIVTDFAGNPRGIIRTSAVTLLPFCEIDFSIASREGEDECIETWVAGHRRYFTNEGKLLDYEFSEDMIVVFEDFELVYKE